MENITLIGRNEFGYYTATGNQSCVLLATLNLLKDAHGLSSSDLNDVIDRWAELVDQDRARTFVAPFQIPLTIEQITGGAFFGKVMDPNASGLVRARGLSEKYALDIARYNSSTLPFIFGIKAGEGNYHAMAALSFDTEKGCRVIDDGKPVDMRVLPSIGIAYKIERNS